MKKIVVVILNFINYEETFGCVDSVLLQKYSNFEIVIVDNGSANKSYEKLKDKYKKNKSVHILRANKNYGFAKGNNIGITYARKNLSADFVLLMNSDIRLIDTDYIFALSSRYRQNIAILGSRIIQRDGSIQRKYFEFVRFPETLFYYLQLIGDYFNFYLLSEKMEKILLKYKRIEILHGSCFMLTPSFFKYYKFLYPKTFLYCEEILLYIMCRNVDLEEKKVESIFVIHKGKQSTKYLGKDIFLIKKKYLISSYKYVVWESFKTYMKIKYNGVLKK